MADNLNALYEAGKGMPKPTAKPVPMTGNSMGKGMTNRGMVTGNAMKQPAVTKVEDYMGFAFDAAVRRGTDAARLALKAKMRQDGRSEAVQLAELKKFDDTIAKQQSLKRDAGLGEGTENAYRDKNVSKGMTPGKAQEYAMNKKRIDATNASMANAGRAVKSVGNFLNASGRQSENSDFIPM